MPTSASEPFLALYKRLERELNAASSGAPVTITPICDLKLTLKARVSIWTRFEVRRKTVAGVAPLGETVGGEVEARLALKATDVDSVSATEIKRQIEARAAEGWVDFFNDAQGKWPGDALSDRRSVVRKCTACAGAGGFVCDSCEGRGEKKCDRCSGAGEVDEICPSCGGGSKPQRSGVARMWDEATLVFRERKDVGEAAESCETCSGAGARRTTCGKCDGAKKVTCELCKGPGRIDCADCAGTGSQTDQYAPALRFEHSTFLDSDPMLSDAAQAKLRRGVRMLTQTGALKPKLENIQTDGAGYFATYSAEVPFVAMRVSVGRRSPRVMAEVYAIGDKPMMIDPPPLIDILHQRALDRLRMASRDGARDIADMMSERSLGRAALRAAARRDLRFDASEFEPLATTSFAARMFDLAKSCHRFVGWRARSWFWPAAAVAAPAMIATLDATGATSAFAGWTSVAVAAGGADPSIAQHEAAKAGTVAARTIAIGLWWLLALTASALLYRYTVRQILGVSRSASYWDAIRSGPTPLLGLVAGVALTTLLVSMPPPDSALLARAGQVAKGVAQREAAVEERRREERARLEAEARAAERWRLTRTEDGALTARIMAEGEPLGELTLRCDRGDLRMRFVTTEAFERQGEGPLSVGLSTNRRALGITPARVDKGELTWTVSRNAVSALRYGTWMRLEILDGEVRHRIRQFTLDGSADVLDRATAACPKR